MKSSSIERHIAHLSQCLRETITTQMAKQHISLSFFQGLILLHIGEFERCTAHDLVVQTKKDKAQITRLVNELIELKMVVREKSQQDKRQSLLSLTDEGIVLFAQIKQLRAEIKQQMTQGLSDEQQQQLQQWLGMMERNLSY